MTTPATLPADRPTESTRPVRLGVAVFLGFLALILFSVALYHAINATELGTVKSEVPGTWGQAFKAPTVWPYLVWSALGCVAALVGVYFLSRCRDDQPSRLVLLLSVVSFGITLFAVLIPITLLAQAYSAGIASNAISKPVFLWGVVLTGLFAVAGSLLLTPQARESVYLRVLVMSIGCAVGFITLLLGFVLPLTVYSSTIAKGLEAWRENWPAVVWPGLAIFGSLVLMFATLQLGRGMERRSQNIRRLVYGYNAILTGLLLLSVLGLVNVIAYAEPFTRFFGKPFDWTAGNLNALSPATLNMLADLQEPVKVYTFTFQPNKEDFILNSSGDLKTLLDNCKSLTPKFTWEAVSGSAESLTTLRGLMEKYSITDPDGILVLFGKESAGSLPAYTFIKAKDLLRPPIQVPGQPPASNQYRFIGEGALLNGIQSLFEGKMTIYLTQGHGEWTADSPPQGMPRAAARDAGKLAALKQKLTSRRGVEVKSLLLDGKTKEVPPDASVVVIAHPETEFGKKDLSILRDYLRRERKAKKVKDKSGKEVEEETVSAGRLMLFLESLTVKEGGSKKVVRTGLEPLLAEYNVKLGEDRILSLSRNPGNAYYVPMPGSTNAIAAAFRRQQFIFSNAQTVQPLAAQPPGKLVEQLFVTLLIPQMPVWRETNPNAEDSALIQKLTQDDEFLEKTISRVPLCVAVAVSDQGASAAPRDSDHAGLTKDTPRMVVFGTASWLDNESLAGAGGGSYLGLFTSSLSWLREKTAVGDTSTIESKDRKVYSLGLTEEQRGRVIFMPLMILVLGIFGMGMGVWIVRRR
jgi:ABC-type uncharacterized transport system